MLHNLTDPFLDIQERMNEVFDRFFNEFSLAPFNGWGNLGDFSPRLDVTETEKELLVSVELPGLEAEDVDVSLTSGWLVIRGEKRA